MKRRATTPEDYDLKRAHILRIAAMEFVRKGYDRANVNTIADLAGVGTGTIYRYVTSKEQLFHDVLLTLMEPPATGLAISMSADATLMGRDRLKRVVDALTMAARADPTALALQASAIYALGVEPETRDVVIQQLLYWSSQYQEMLLDQEENGSMRKVDARITGVLLLCFLHAYARLPRILGYGDEWGTEDWNESLIDLLWNGLAPSHNSKKRTKYHHEEQGTSEESHP